MEKSFQYQQSDIFYRVSGEGQPIVLLHGFGEDSTIWQQQVDFLQKYCKLIVPDLPGSGKSVILEGENTGIDAYAACIAALLEHEEIASCIMLGHSMGGYITLAFAEHYPEKFKGFGLIHSTAFADTEEKKSNRRQGIRMIEEYGAYSFLKNTIPNLFSKEFKNTSQEKVEQLIEKAKGFSNEALAQYYFAMINRPDRTAALKSATVPVLLIIGTEDTAAPLNDLMKQVDLPEISHIHILENVAHMSMLEAPELLNAHLLKFADSVFAI